MCSDNHGPLDFVTLTRLGEVINLRSSSQYNIVNYTRIYSFSRHNTCLTLRSQIFVIYVPQQIVQEINYARMEQYKIYMIRQ